MSISGLNVFGKICFKLNEQRLALHIFISTALNHFTMDPTQLMKSFKFVHAWVKY